MKIIFLYITSVLLMCGCEQKTDHESRKETGVYYTCSMDPQVIETKPGKCPICHMDLTLIKMDQIRKNGLKLSDDQVRLANIKTQTVNFDYLKNKVFATGTVKENQNNIRFVSARIDGRIDRLSIKTKGIAIQKGQILYEIYSEKLAATQSEFIQNWEQLSGNPGNLLFKVIHEKVSEKLILRGLTKLQVEQLKLFKKPRIPYPILSPVSGVVKSVFISEGSTVMEGDQLLELTGYESLWVEAQFYPNETDIKTGSKVSVYVEGIVKAIEGKVEQVFPQVSPSSLANLVRISVMSNKQDLRPGMQANIAWHKEGTKTLIIPSNAILRDSKRNTVWVKNKDHVYEPKVVHLGNISEGKAEVLNGLKEGDEIVISGAYLLQSEYVFKKGYSTE